MCCAVCGTAWLAQVQAILPLLDKPTVFFGHSMGSHVMFKVAQALYAAGQPIPIHLIASGRTPPHMLHPDRQCAPAPLLLL